jgi:LuxR family quorum sensing-dependent transcriptional regulator
VTDPHETLTHRELECIRWVVAGKTDVEIANLLGVSQTTVRTHIDQARRKLGARSRAQAVARLVLSGLC